MSFPSRKGTWTGRKRRRWSTRTQAIRSVGEGEFPTPEGLSSTLTEVVPAKSHWFGLVAQIVKVYGDHYLRSMSPSSESELLDSIANGSELAAKQYLDNDFLEKYEKGVIAPFRASMSKN